MQHLQARVRSGAPIDFVCFWGHTPKAAFSVDKSCLSQWYPASFIVNGTTYATAEHFMMAEKARVFGDVVTREQILACTDPKEAKALGRSVRGFDSMVWQHVCIDVVTRGNHAKFTQHHDLRAFLLGTGDAVLVEASPVDLVWGIGFAEDDVNARNPLLWRGQNLLGFTLMDVRASLQKTA
jgi:hypothetical protein